LNLTTAIKHVPNAIALSLTIGLAGRMANRLVVGHLLGSLKRVPVVIIHMIPLGTFAGPLLLAGAVKSKTADDYVSLGGTEETPSLFYKISVPKTL
jgi:hypothetical protein